MKQSAFRHFLFYEATYKVNILLLVGDSNKADKYMRKNFQAELDFSPCGGRASALRGDGGQLMVVWMPEFKRDIESTTLLMHEVIHVALFVFENVGITVNAEHSEQLTYYCEMIMRKFLEFLKA